MQIIRRKDPDELTSEDENSITSPVKGSKELRLAFLENDDLKCLITEDYEEARRSFQGKNYKASILLCGSILEAILTALLVQKRPAGIDTKKLYKDFNLSKLINATKKYNLITEKALFGLLESLRHYRNIIHPGVQVRKSISADGSKASIALETIHLLVKHLNDTK